MGEVIAVAHAADPRLEEYLHLTDVARRRRVEPELGGVGIFIAEGEPVVRRALDAGFAMRSLLLDRKRLPAFEDVLADSAAPAYVATSTVLRAVTGFHVHRGVLASFARKPQPSVESLLSTAQRLLLCEALTSTTNLGAVLRSAAALGMDGVLLSPECCDPLYRRSVRVSMGEALRLPIARLEPWPDTLEQVHDAGFTVLALTPDDDATPIGSMQFDSKVALLVGEEGSGLTPAAIAAADRRVRIPMQAGVDSLNVAAATAIACYLVGGVDRG